MCFDRNVNEIRNFELFEKVIGAPPLTGVSKDEPAHSAVVLRCGSEKNVPGTYTIFTTHCYFRIF